MGLFGMFLNVISGGVLLGETIANSNLDSKYKQDAIRRGNPVWTDCNGKTYLVSTGEQVYETPDMKVKSLKTDKVVYDYRAESIKRCNQKAIADAKAKGKNHAYLTYPEFGKKRYNTELSTMRRFYLRNNGRGWDDETNKFYKIYYTDGKATISKYNEECKDEVVEITKEEFLSLGGSEFTWEQFAVYL